MKGMVMPGTLFEELGFNYIGPLDGHDLQDPRELALPAQGGGGEPPLAGHDPEAGQRQRRAAGPVRRPRRHHRLTGWLARLARPAFPLITRLTE